MDFTYYVAMTITVFYLLFRSIDKKNHLWVHLLHEILVVFFASLARYMESEELISLTFALIVGLYSVDIFHVSGLYILHHFMSILLGIVLKLCTFRLQLMGCLILNIEISTIFLTIKYMIEDGLIKPGPRIELFNKILFAITFIITRPIRVPIIIYTTYETLIEDCPFTYSYILFLLCSFTVLQYVWAYKVILSVKKSLIKFYE